MSNILKRFFGGPRGGRGVAEGGDSPRIVSDISDAVKALFQVEAHRIKVVKMSSKEDGT